MIWDILNIYPILVLSPFLWCSLKQHFLKELPRVFCLPSLPLSPLRNVSISAILVRFILSRSSRFSLISKFQLGNCSLSRGPIGPGPRRVYLLEKLCGILAKNTSSRRRVVLFKCCPMSVWEGKGEDEGKILRSTNCPQAQLSKTWVLGCENPRNMW